MHRTVSHDSLSYISQPVSAVFSKNRCSEIHTIKHLNTLCGHNEEFLNVKPLVHKVTATL